MLITLFVDHSEQMKPLLVEMTKLRLMAGAIRDAKIPNEYIQKYEELNKQLEPMLLELVKSGELRLVHFNWKAEDFVGKSEILDLGTPVG
jgi:hypothetical protein